jgi:hypothetical protein
VSKRDVTDDQGRRWYCRLHPDGGGTLIAECQDSGGGSPAGPFLLLGTRTDWLSMPREELVRLILAAEADQ